MAQGGRETFGDESLKNWEYLCAGGCGVVYKAKHKDLGIVVIKLLDGDDSSGTLYAALCREAEYMEAADHQYVPRAYGMYHGCPPTMGSNKRHGIVMELMERDSLHSFLKTLSNKPPPWPLAFRLANQVALAMDYLHSKKDLVHMDLKPGNILLDAKLNAKIADFGFSTVSNSVRSTNGENKGYTPNYTPPEAFRDTYRRVRSYDVYSYGIVLWNILTGESPYPGMDQSVLTYRIRRGERPDLHKIDVRKAAGLKDLVDLMKRCWDPEPNKRPSFRECVEVTSRVFSTHKKGIAAAVFEMMPPVPNLTLPDPKKLSSHLFLEKLDTQYRPHLAESGYPVPPGSTNRQELDAGSRQQTPLETPGVPSGEDWIPSQWLDSFNNMLDSELDTEDPWSLNFTYSQTDYISTEERRKGWKVYSHCAFGKFHCSPCSWEWTSARVVVLFRYRLRGGAGRGTVIMRPFGQACRGCPDDGFVLPGFTDEVVENTLSHLFGKILKNCYEEEEDDDEDDDDDGDGDDDDDNGGWSVCSGKVKTKPHQEDLCEACLAGICCQDD